MSKWNDGTGFWRALIARVLGDDQAQFVLLVQIMHGYILFYFCNNGLFSEELPDCQPVQSIFLPYRVPKNWGSIWACVVRMLARYLETRNGQASRKEKRASAAGLLAAGGSVPVHHYHYYYYYYNTKLIHTITNLKSVSLQFQPQAAASQEFKSPALTHSSHS